MKEGLSLRDEAAKNPCTPYRASTVPTPTGDNPRPPLLVPTRIALPEMPLLIIVPLHDRRTETGLDERHAGEIP